MFQKGMMDAQEFKQGRERDKALSAAFERSVKDPCKYFDGHPPPRTMAKL